MMDERPLRGLLLDLDDTLYDYAPREQLARTATIERIASELELPKEFVKKYWDESRATVKARLGNTAASHSRLLYLSELAYRIDNRSLARIREWERFYWTQFLRTARLRRGALDLLRGWRGRGGKIAIVTDLTAEIQLWKLEVFRLFSYIDVLVTSEEVGSDKPHPEVFLLAMQRLAMDAHECVVVGDSIAKDGAAARACGVQYLEVASSHGRGPKLEDVARLILGE